MKSILAIAAAFAATTTAAVAAINPIPEPGSLSLVALAIAGVALVARKKK